ncbi:MAG: SIS domain-containing protein [Anaerolineales bacterium]
MTVSPMTVASQYLHDLVGCIQAMSLEEIAALADAIYQAYCDNKQVFVVGNGGSASTASHIAADLGKNILPDLYGGPLARLRVTALTDNMGWITALANDVGYEYIFSEQLKNLGQPGDLLLAISGSGNSTNVVEAVKVAQKFGLRTFGILGFAGGKLQNMVEAYVLVRSNNYGFIEDIHLILNHIIVTYLRARLRGQGSKRVGAKG